MLKDLGAIALFLGVVLNAYHYYKLHTWSKKDKNFDLILKIVNDLKEIRDKILEIEENQYEYSHQINQYNYSIISINEFGEQIPKLDGKPSQNLCYRIGKFEQKTIKIYQDYMFIVKFKKSIQEENFIEKKITDRFISDIENEIKNRLSTLFITFCHWDETIYNHYGEAYTTMRDLVNCEDSVSIEELFKDIK